MKPGRIQTTRERKKNMCALQNGDIDKTTAFKVGECTARRVIYLYTAPIQKRCCMMYRAILHKTSINSLLPNMRCLCLPRHGYTKHTASNNRPEAYPSCIYLLKGKKKKKALRGDKKDKRQHENNSLLVMQCRCSLKNWSQNRKKTGCLSSERTCQSGGQQIA